MADDTHFAIRIRPTLQPDEPQSLCACSENSKADLAAENTEKLRTAKTKIVRIKTNLIDLLDHWLIRLKRSSSEEGGPTRSLFVFNKMSHGLAANGRNGD